jgi:hypothetical protein
MTVREGTGHHPFRTPASCAFAAASRHETPHTPVGSLVEVVVARVTDKAELPFTATGNFKKIALAEQLSAAMRVE